MAYSPSMYICMSDHLISTVYVAEDILTNKNKIIRNSCPILQHRPL